MALTRITTMPGAGVVLIAACAMAPLPVQAATGKAAAPRPDQLVGVAVHADSGESLGVIERVIESGGPAAQVVVSVAGAEHRLVTIPVSHLRFTQRPGPVDVVAGYGVVGTAAPGVTGPFGTAHLAATDAAMQVQPEGGPAGTMIVLPGATAQSILALPAAK